MATNTFQTNAILAKEIMADFHNHLGFLKNVNKQYSAEFSKTGAEVGNTINVRKPFRPVVQQGPTIVPQGITDSSVPFTLNRFWSVPIQISDVDRTLSIKEIRDRILLPSMTKLAAQMDFEAHYAAVNGVYPTANSAGSYAVGGSGPVNTVIGTPGTTIGTSGGSATNLLQYNAPQAFLNAGMLLDNMCAPDDGNRTCILNSAAQAQSIGALAGLQNPQGTISKQYEKGHIADALGFKFIKDQNVASFTPTAVAIGNITLTNNTATCTSSTGTGVIPAGTTFTVAGYYSVNPENQQPTGVLQQFVVTASTDAGSALPIYPTPKLVGSGIADGNVWTSTGAVLGAVAGTLTSGSSATPYAQNLAFHANAFTFATADLPLPGGVERAAREQDNGISIRVVSFWDGMSSSEITRLDVLGGFACLRPEWAVRLTN